jgi:hypothetical protein
MHEQAIGQSQKYSTCGLTLIETSRTEIPARINSPILGNDHTISDSPRKLQRQCGLLSASASAAKSPLVLVYQERRRGDAA